MPKTPPRKRSSRRLRYEDPLVRVHKAGRAMQRERRRLGLSQGAYLEYLTEKLRKKGHPV